MYEVSEKHNSLGVGEDRNQKVKLLLWHIFKMLSYTHMMGTMQDVQMPELFSNYSDSLELFSNYSEDSLEILSAQLWWKYLCSRLMQKTSEKGEYLFYSSLKRENANKMVTFLFWFTRCLSLRQLCPAEYQNKE